MECFNIFGQDDEVSDEHKEERQHREAAKGIEQEELDNEKINVSRCSDKYRGSEYGLFCCNMQRGQHRKQEARTDCATDLWLGSNGQHGQHSRS